MLKPDAFKALDMLNAVASVGVIASMRPSPTSMERNLGGGFLSNRDVNELRRAICPLLREATAHQHNVTIRLSNANNYSVAATTIRVLFLLSLLMVKKHNSQGSDDGDGNDCSNNDLR